MSEVLGGRRILVPHGGRAGGAAAAEIRRRGGVAVVAPLTMTLPAEDPGPLLSAAQRLVRGKYDVCAVTSANGAEALGAALRGAVPAACFAAVGPGTSRALREHGIRVDLLPEHDYSSHGLADALIRVLGDARAGGARPHRILLPLSELADTSLEDALTAAGHRPEGVSAYRTVPAPRDVAVESGIADGGFDAILVLSASGAAEIALRFPAIPRRTLLAAIGSATADALRARGLAASVVATEHTVTGLLDALTARIAETIARPREGASR